MCFSTNLVRYKNDIHDTLWALKRPEFPGGNGIKDLVHHISVIIMGGDYGWTSFVRIPNADYDDNDNRDNDGNGTKVSRLQLSSQKINTTYMAHSWMLKLEVPRDFA